MGRYVGETKEKVREILVKSMGGILLIDEAYGLLGGSYMGGGSYGAEAILSLVELMTSDMFHGNILIIMAGYKDQMQKLFRNSNEGFASRFEKLYLDFLPWKAEHATEFCVDLIERSNKRITDDAKEHM